MASLGQLVLSGVAAVVPPGPVALVGFPPHRNAGDSACWLGARRALDAAGASLAYACDLRTYDRRALAATMREGGTIAIAGGGNLGDLYPMQATREAMMKDFPSMKIVQLPQSIWFAEPANAARFSRLANRHADWTLLVREEQSLHLAAGLGLAATLLPDLAFALGPVTRTVEPTVDVAWLSRTDREAQHEPPSSAEDVFLFDWLDELIHEVPPSKTERRAALLQERLHARAFEPDERRRTWRRLCATYDLVAAWRTRRGVELLSRGRAAVTDRLHGHLLCILAGIPHVVLDNNNGKVASTWRTWTHTSSLAHFADSSDQALSEARSLAGLSSSA